MDPERKTTLTLLAMTAGFALLAWAFVRVPARPPLLARAPLVPAAALAIVPGTIRISAAQLASSGGDTSGLNCYACHHADQPPVITYDADHHVVLPKEHADLIISMRNCAECHPPNNPVQLEYADDGSLKMPKAHEALLVMRHGQSTRNENCYNCHLPNRLDRLHTAEGAVLTFDQATVLCGGCHGTTYRDWKAGAHGRTSGYWDRAAGPVTRQQCTSCHDPHSPRVTGLIPMPGPHLLHPPSASAHASAPL